MTAILKPKSEILNAFVSCCDVSIAVNEPSPAKNTEAEPGALKAFTLTLPAVEIVANLVSTIAAEALISALTIAPSAILADVIALSETVVCL